MKKRSKLIKVKKPPIDEGSQYTDELFAELRDKIAEEYGKAYRQVAEKCDKYFANFKVLDAKRRKQVQEGKLSEEEYKTWRTRYMITGKRWTAMRDTLAEDLVRVDEKARSIINGYIPEAYAMNFNFGVYETEKGGRVDTSFTLYSRETVERLMKDDPTLLPYARTGSKTATELIDSPDMIWNRKQVNSAITQGILQGDDLRTISKRLQSVTNMDQRAALRNARTMMTGAQNAGRIDAYGRAESFGLHVRKMWLATLDFHTRPSHQALDGETVPLNETFSNDLMYPGDPDGEPEELYNCRCTIVGDTEEYPASDMKRYDNIAGKAIEFVTYKEWAEAHDA